MRLVFMGTPDFAVPSLRALALSAHRVVGVFTQPDRPAGRGKQLRPSPVKVAALELGLTVFQPQRIKAADSVALLRELKPDCIVVVAYGQLLSKEILDLPPQGCINVHASLLPAYRGAAPIHWAVINGEKVTGVTTMLMDEGLDTGDILLQKELTVASTATTGEIHDTLAVAGSELLLETLQEWESGRLRPTPQSGEPSYAPLLKRTDEELDWNSSAIILYNRIRGLNPWPGAYTFFRGETLKVWQGMVETSFPPVNKAEVKPGEIVAITEQGILVNTGEGLICLTQLQPAGKRIMPARDFVLGRHVKPGEVLGQ